MTSNASPSTRILGSLRSAGGKGVVRIEDRYGTGIDDLPVEAWEFSSRAAKKLR